MIKQHLWRLLSISAVFVFYEVCSPIRMTRRNFIFQYSVSLIKAVIAIAKKFTVADERKRGFSEYRKEFSKFFYISLQIVKNVI